DSGMPGVQVFWRDFADDPNTPETQPGPNRNELCPVSMGQARDIHKRGAWYWDTLGDRKHNGRWVKLERNPRPGMTLLLRSTDGGYDEAVGFDASHKKPSVPIVPHDDASKGDAYSEDWRSRQ